MPRFLQRAWGACLLSPAVYEEVEADTTATGQAAALVIVVSIATGIGLLDAHTPAVQSVVAGTVAGVGAWVSWAGLTYLIGTHVLPEPTTRADLGELLRTLAFAATPGLIQVLGIVPGWRPFVFAVASLWMLAAMIVAVRQALDYTSTVRAVGVCLAAWALALALAAVIANLLAPGVG